MTPLSLADQKAANVLFELSYHLLGRSEDIVAFADRMREFWTVVHRQERSAALNRGPLRKAAERRTPSGMSQAVRQIFDEAQPADNTVTKKHNMAQLIEQAELEHRDTPLVPDPRKEEP